MEDCRFSHSNFTDNWLLDLLFVLNPVISSATDGGWVYLNFVEVL